MRNYSKVGNKNGKPGYRTPASFRLKQNTKIQRAKKYKSQLSNNK